MSDKKKENINWDDREAELLELCDRYSRHDRTYNCLIPVSDGKDSFYPAHTLKYKYGVYPLTVTQAPHIYTDWGCENFQAWLNAAFDNYLMTLNPKMHRLLTRLAVEIYFILFSLLYLAKNHLPLKQLQ